MPKIVLDDTSGGYNLSKINSNFVKIANALNNQVLYRVGVGSEPNALATDLDLSGKRVYNLPAPNSLNEAARLQDVQDAVADRVGGYKGPIASEAAMLALTGLIIGDKVKRTDLGGQVFELVYLPSTSIDSWLAYGGVSSGTPASVYADSYADAYA